MHHPIPERLSQTLSIFQTVPRHRHCLGNTPISSNTSLNISSALLLVYYTLPKQQKLAKMCTYCGPCVYCLVIIFLLFFLFLKAVFKALTVFLVFIPLYCCIPLWVIFWHRLSLMNFQLQWFNLIQTHIGV